MTQKRDSYKVAVLLCTYNGEKYLEEQINSILNQQGVSVNIFIRDDGSTDGTVSIIKKYVEQFHNISFVDCGKHLGPGLGFLKLLKYVFHRCAPFDYYSFSDQDDIWLSDKLLAAVKMMQDKTNTPILYCSNQYIYQDGQVIRERFDKDPDISLEGHISKNYLSGCTMVLNYELAKIVAEAKYPSRQLLKYRLHDSMIFLIALCTGEVVYDKTPHIYYRIHENNTVGLKNITFKERLKKLFNQDAKNLRRNTAQYLIKNYTVKEDKKRFLLDFCNYAHDKEARKRIMRNKRITLLSGENRSLFIIKILSDYI